MVKYEKSLPTLGKMLKSHNAVSAFSLIRCSKLWLCWSSRINTNLTALGIFSLIKTSLYVASHGKIGQNIDCERGALRLVAAGGKNLRTVRSKQLDFV